MGITVHSYVVYHNVVYKKRRIRTLKTGLSPSFKAILCKKFRNERMGLVWASPGSNIHPKKENQNSPHMKNIVNRLFLIAFRTPNSKQN